jgi:DNA polymerase III delta subunit
MDVLEAIDEVRKGSVRPVYVFVGDESFLIDRAVKMLRAATVGEGIAGFNEDVFHGAKGLDGNKIVSAATTLPMMAAKRFILVRHAEAMNADAHAPLIGYFKDPNPSTCFVVTADKIPGNTKFGRAAKAHRFDAKRLKGHALEKLAVTEAAGAPPFKARELRLAAKQFSLPKLTSAFTTIAEADMLLKGSKAPDDIILLDTVLRLCR